MSKANINIEKTNRPQHKVNLSSYNLYILHEQLKSLELFIRNISKSNTNQTSLLKKKNLEQDKTFNKCLELMGKIIHLS